MYSKLAFKNLKRSFKDYTIYFLTLVFGVCIFYVFNAIGSQSILFDISEAHRSMFNMINNVMGVASVFISFILGFLIVYANSYLIKRRKKEFGVYITLGMDTSKLSSMLFMETAIVGVISLAVGLSLGIFASQGLSIITAKFFQVNLLKFKFVFSIDAFKKTVLCFGLIYIVILIFNSLTIRKVKLINLIAASKKNEKVRIKSLWVSVVLFIVGVIALGLAYYTILNAGVAIVDLTKLLVAVVLGVIGTFLFFFSLTGFLLRVVQSNKRHYFKNLNMFILRQINSKINTTFISMAFICLMLFIAICALSGGMGISSALNADLKDLSQFDICFWNYTGSDIDEQLRDLGINLNEYSKEKATVTLYDSGNGYADFLTEKGKRLSATYYPIMTNESIPVVKLSDFNSLMEMLNRKTIVLDEGEYAMFADVNDTASAMEDSMNAGTELNINGRILKPASDKVIDVTFYNSMMKANVGTVVVNDNIVDGLISESTYVNLNYNDDGVNLEVLLDSLENRNTGNDFYRYITKETVMIQSTSIGAMASYLAIYIGIIFLITSAAVLALQQLSEADDNRERYELLKKLGVEDSMVNKSILVQMGIYFMMPLALALVHAIVGIKVFNDIVTAFGNANMVRNSIITAIFLVFIYGGYFVATYIGGKKMIN